MLNKKKEGGFLNPDYEKWEIRLGLIALCLMAIVFVALLGKVIFG